MSIPTIAFMMTVALYFMYESIRNLYMYYTEKLDIHIFSYIELERYIRDIKICSFGGFGLVIVGIFQDSYLVVLSATISMILGNVMYKRKLKKEAMRDHHQEELEFFQKIIDDPESSDDDKEAARSLKKTSIRLGKDGGLKAGLMKGMKEMKDYESK
ncbi:hypothetical protein EVJ32_10930 [Exiguobacterium sp. SH5S4]|uniref:hypothetical protein n=1 Tax=Exiguobacterium sp. SH5S4 TaxID=2510961 RepID=UPI00103B7B50|nr:hypothetical protein [Exiguobacterium sp. SH5S4]TCI25305.1 hypothetical protein EVJ32_10930 [Exiguobacterium sp. SH5S4]